MNKFARNDAVASGRWARQACAAMMAVMLIGASPTRAADPAPSSPAPTTLTPDATILLRHTSKVLASARSLTLDLEALREVRLDDGRIASLASSTAIAVRRPNQMRADMRGDATIADIIYDGKAVVVHSVAQRLYAEGPAPNTLDATLLVLQDKLGMPIDIGDLLASDPFSKLTADTTGDIVSPTVINGIPAWHLVLRSGDVAWELWVRQDETSLPIMASVTRDGLQTLYRFDDWRLDPALDASLFHFVPPAGDAKIPFVFLKEE